MATANDAINYHYENLSDSEQMEIVKQLFESTGIVHHHCSGHGHVQGQYHEFLLCQGDDWSAAELNIPMELSLLAGNYGLWRYGDVHGFRVLHSETCCCCSNTKLTEMTSGYG